MRRACVLHSSLRPGFILCTSKAHIYSPRSVCRNITNDTAVPSRIYVRLRKVNSRCMFILPRTVYLRRSPDCSPLHQVPFFLQKYTTPLLHAPASHITAFLLLHEITALVPLFGLTACFHYANWVPESFSEGEWVSKGMEKWGGYLRKKGWLTEEEATVVEPPKTGAKGSFAKWWDDREGGSRVLLE